MADPKIACRHPGKLNPDGTCSKCGEPIFDRRITKKEDKK